MSVFVFARARRKNVGFPRIMVRLYRVAGLRADEGIGPYDARVCLPSAGVDLRIDPQPCKIPEKPKQTAFRGDL
jgi:hypothetical protein